MRSVAQKLHKIILRCICDDSGKTSKGSSESPAAGELHGTGTRQEERIASEVP